MSREQQIKDWFDNGMTDEEAKSIVDKSEGKPIYLRRISGQPPHITEKEI